MKDFFKDRTWDDYLAMLVMVLVVGGLIIFFIGFYWGFKLPEGTDPLLELALGGQKISVSKTLSELKGGNSSIGLVYTDLLGEGRLNLFTLAGTLTPNSGTLFIMVVVSLIGFSLIMLGILIMIVTIIVGLTLDMIARKKAKKALQG